MTLDDIRFFINGVECVDEPEPAFTTIVDWRARTRSRLQELVDKIEALCVDTAPLADDDKASKMIEMREYFDKLNNNDAAIDTMLPTFDNPIETRGNRYNGVGSDRLLITFTGLPTIRADDDDDDDDDDDNVIMFDDTVVRTVDSDKTVTSVDAQKVREASAVARLRTTVSSSNGRRPAMLGLRTVITITNNYAWFRHVYVTNSKINTSRTTVVKMTLVDMPEVTDADLVFLKSFRDIALIGLTGVSDVSALADVPALTVSGCGCADVSRHQQSSSSSSSS